MFLTNRIELPIILTIVIGVGAISAFIAIYIIVPYLLPELFIGMAGRAASLFSVMVYLAAVFTVCHKVLISLRIHRIKSIPYFIPLLAYILFGVIVNVYAPKFDYSRWVFITISLPVLYMVITSNLRDHKIGEIIIVGVIIGGTIVSILMTFTDASGNFPSFRGVIRHRGAAYFLGQSLGPVALATISGLSLTCAVVMQISTTSGWIAILMFITLPFLVIALAASGGRMAILAVLLTLSIILLKKKIQTNWIKKGFSIVMGLVGIIIIVLLSNRYNSQIINRLRRIPATLFSYRTDRAILERITVWSNAILMIKRHPFGIGFDAFFNEYGLTPHNEFINIFLGTGLQGFITFSIFSFLVIRRCYLGAKKNKSEIAVPLTAFSGGLFMFFVSFTGAWTYSNTVAAVMIWTIISVGVSLSFGTKPSLD